MKGRLKLQQGFLAIVLVALASTASAAMIEGDIAFSGFHRPGDVTGSPGTTAGTIDFNFLEFAVGTGDFAFLSPAVSGNLFTSMPFDATGAIATPINPLFTITTLAGNTARTVSFSLQSGTVFKNINGGVETWTVAGTGTFTLDGFDDTAGNFVYTNQGNNSTSFSAQAVSEVPLPAAVWLFGTGLLGLAGVARRRNQVSA